MMQVPASSTVLHRRTGYRDVFRHSVRLRQAAHVPLGESLVRDLLEVKDIAQLYELWCYFALARILESEIGTPATARRLVPSAFSVGVPWDFQIAWPGKATLTYNARFSHSRGQLRHSYSVPLRPDITLEAPRTGGTSLHLFDAKFRLQSLKLAMPIDDADSDDQADERRGTFVRGDLYKMHAYRDAIPAVESVWVLYPGTEFRFFCANGTRLMDVAEAANNGLEGVGAIPFTPPADTSNALGAVLRRLLRR